MEEEIRLLIQDDIKITRFVYTLARLNIDATHYLSNNSTVIFRLLGQAVSVHDEAYDTYFRMIEQCAHSGEDLTHELLRLWSVEIYEAISRITD